MPSVWDAAYFSALAFIGACLFLAALLVAGYLIGGGK